MLIFSVSFQIDQMPEGEEKLILRLYIVVCCQKVAFGPVWTWNGEVAGYGSCAIPRTWNVCLGVSRLRSYTCSDVGWNFTMSGMHSIGGMRYDNIGVVLVRLAPVRLKEQHLQNT